MYQIPPEGQRRAVADNDAMNNAAACHLNKVAFSKGFVAAFRYWCSGHDDDDASFRLAKEVSSEDHW
jgi:hypothetical protein